ncbi:hypothetical protein AOQ84DRAFT_420820 [Glonium stellatum]|uniref:NACHT domain-containing protein n=1 Tax=Glonium stellatum TaxID=574774 RepID=A0A8E2F833_9PEZI|nr:hypothetical protein AOQ84DRAFT_420820 [Glonium stellatum]
MPFSSKLSVIKEKLSRRSQSPSGLRTADKSSVAAIPTPSPLRQPLSARTESPTAQETQKDALPDLWGEALRRLSDEERNAVEEFFVPQHSSNSTPELLGQVQEAVMQQRDKHEGKRWTIQFNGQQVVLRDKVQKILVWLNKFKETGDIMVNYDPVHLALPWAGIRFLLQAAVAESQQMEALLVGLDTTTYLVSRCQVYEILYLSGASQQQTEAIINLKRILVMLYSTILGFFAAAAKLYRGKAGSRALSAILNPDKISGLTQKCHKLANEAHIEAENCERDVNRAARQDLHNSGEKLKSVLDDLRVAFEQKVIVLWERLEREDRTRVLQWISDIPFKDIHAQARDGRTQGTGSWLLNHSKFQLWRKEEKPLTLWLHGSPGAGKTKLVSTIVDNLLETLDENDALAYFYCDSNIPNRRSPVPILRSYLRQLATSRKGNAIQSSLHDTYQQRANEGWASKDLGMDEILEALLQLVDNFPQVVIVLDALDECERDTRAQLVKALNDIINRTARTVKVFISSRPDTDIRDRMESALSIGITATDNINDITSFITEAVSVCPKDSPDLKYWRDKMPNALRQEICETLVAKSNGMFQWAKLQVAQLRKLESERDIRARLGKLPKTLIILYEEIWSQIQSQQGNKPVIAQRAFLWLMCAFEPLSPDLLLAAVCQDPEGISIEPVYIDFDYILAACHNLLVVDPHQNVCGFSHLSVYEHFEAVWKSNLSHVFAAKVCLLCLTFVDPVKFFLRKDRSSTARDKDWSSLNVECSSFNKGESSIEGDELSTKGNELCAEEDGSSIEAEDGFFIKGAELFADEDESPVEEDRSSIERAAHDSLNVLWHYACLNWPRHVRAHDKKEPDLHLTTILKRFLGPMCKGSASYKRWLEGWYGRHGRYLLPSIENPDDLPPIIIAEHFKFYNILLDWCDPKIYERVEGEDVLLIAAARSGSLQLVQLLLRSSVDVNIGISGSGLALLEAVKSGNLEIMKLLVEAGADIEPMNASGDLGLLGRSYNNADASMVQLLIDHGAKFDNVEVFASAAKYGDEKMMAQIFRQGAFIGDKDEACNYALVKAAEAGETRMIQYLVELGAEINPTKGFDGGFALISAIEAIGHYHVKDPEFRLQQRSVIALLINLGADVNKRGGKYGNALAAAVRIDDEVIVRHLLGSAPLAMGLEENRGLLAIAVSQDNKRLIELLFAHQANINTPGGMDIYDGRVYETPLIEAVKKGSLGVLRILLDRGVDINAHGGPHGSALAVAVYRRDTEMVRLLLSRGADPNVQAGGDNENALIALAGSLIWERAEAYEIATLLLDYGVDVNARGGWHGSALAVAVYRADTEMVKLLLSRGADPYARAGRRNRNALVEALEESHKKRYSILGDLPYDEVVKVLLEFGFDVKAQLHT